MKEVNSKDIPIPYLKSRLNGIMKNSIFKDRKEKRIWKYCISKTEHEKSQVFVKGKIFDLDPGQAVFNRKEWSKNLNIHSTKIYRTVISFRDAGMISLFSIKGRFSIITLLKNPEFRKEDQIDKAKKNKWASREGYIYR